MTIIHMDSRRHVDAASRELDVSADVLEQYDFASNGTEYGKVTLYGVIPDEDTLNDVTGLLEEVEGEPLDLYLVDPISYRERLGVADKSLTEKKLEKDEGVTADGESREETSRIMEMERRKAGRLYPAKYIPGSRKETGKPSYLIDVDRMDKDILMDGIFRSVTEGEGLLEEHDEAHKKAADYFIMSNIEEGIVFNTSLSIGQHLTYGAAVGEGYEDWVIEDITTNQDESWEESRGTERLETAKEEQMTSFIMCVDIADAIPPANLPDREEVYEEEIRPRMDRIIPKMHPNSREVAEDVFGTFRDIPWRPDRDDLFRVYRGVFSAYNDLPEDEMEWNKFAGEGM